MRLLNIGCGPIGIRVPPRYRDCEVVRLDVEPGYEPELLMNALDLDTLEPGQFDATYASHLLEHIYPKDLERFLGGVRHVLTDEGFAEFVVPDALQACQQIARTGEMDAFCYQSAAGPVYGWDMLYGKRAYQERYGGDMAHHNGFSPAMLAAALREFGFPLVYVRTGPWTIAAVACQQPLSAEAKERLGIPDEATGERGLVHPDGGAADVDAVRQRGTVAKLSLPAAPGHRGNGDSPAEAAASGRGAIIPRFPVPGW